MNGAYLSDDASNISQSFWDHENPVLNIIAASSIGCLSFIGLSTYLLVVFIIINNPKTFANKSFYTLLLSLAACDIGQLIPVLFYVVPSILFQRRIFGEGFDTVYGAVGCRTFYYVGLGTVVLIAINRYFAVCRFTSYQQVFQPKRTRLYLIGAWSFGSFNGILLRLPEFGYHFNPNLYAWGFDSSWRNAYYFWYDRAISITVFTNLILCYGAIFRKRPSKVSPMIMHEIDQEERLRREKSERRLALQFGIIVSIFLIYVSTSQINWGDSLAIFLFFALYYIVFLSCNPFIYVIFNSDVRLHVAHIFHKKSGVTADGTVS